MPPPLIGAGGIIILSCASRWALSSSEKDYVKKNYILQEVRKRFLKYVRGSGLIIEKLQLS